MEQPGMEKTRPGIGPLPGKPRVLVAPLDWGLGHATRCIPLIKELLKQGAEVWLACEGAQEILLKKEFPSLPFLTLGGYRIKYARTATGLIRNILFQTPRILKTIREENEWLKSMQTKYQFDLVISDNRYGLYHSDIACIFMTHQLKIKSSLGGWTERILQKRNYKYINRFRECWVPDSATENNLAGELSHPLKKPAVPVKYIGILSRFEQVNNEIKKGHLLILLSGPEPQRTILENKIVEEIANYERTATIVRGLPESLKLLPSTNMIRFYNHLPADELKKEFDQAEWVIARSGYSSVMDIIKLEKKSILIPTPGQTEQEYLGKYLAGRGLAYSVKQKDFTLNTALEKAKTFQYDLSNVDQEVQPIPCF